MQITDRQQKLLRAIIDEFINSAEAVASMHLAEKYNLPISSATIRSEMKQLSDAGYLKQLHTSSGRVPTTTGLRFFINQMIDSLDELELLQQERIKKEIFTNRFSRDDLTIQSLSALSRLTGYPTLLLEGFHINYHGLSLMLDFPEFRELDQLQRLLRIIESPEILSKVFTISKSTKNVKILIGEELGIEGLDAYSFAYASVRLHAGINGTIAVFGPSRMDYPSVIPAVDYISQVISQSVRGWR